MDDYGYDGRYDAPYESPYDPAYDGRHRTFLDTADAEDRLTHLVLVDGRLVDAWTAPADGTRWQHHADRFDRERRPPAPPPPPPTPVHERVLVWLDAAVGGREQLLALTSEPLPDDHFEPDPDLAGHGREALASAIDLLDHAARTLHVTEARAALTATLRAAWESDPEAVLMLASTSRLAGGVVWVAAKANGLLGSAGITTQAVLREVTDCQPQLPVAGKAVRRLVSGYWPDPAPVHPMPDLLLLGRPELLTSATRRRLVQARDQALAARSVAAQRTGEAPAVRSA